jgi:cytochrome c-type biogenesis protein CcmH
VDVSEEIRAQMDSSMRVFVFARSPAMPMPLAAQTFSVGELPLTATLDESTPMAPGMPTLATTDTVIIGARISRGGQPTAESGDFQIITDPIELSDQNEALNLVISEVVP